MRYSLSIIVYYLYYHHRPPKSKRSVGVQLRSPTHRRVCTDGKAGAVITQ